MSYAVNIDDINKLCEDIKLQRIMYNQVITFIKAYNFTNIEEIIEELCNPVTGFSAYEKLNDLFNSNSTKILAVYLVCATRVRKKYEKLGIENQVFVDTMKCFVRFIDECKEKTGEYAFDRAYWTYRQLSMVVFRIKELEYEFKNVDGDRFIKIHIPSDAKFDKENVDISIKEAKKFINNYFKDFRNCRFICNSWLLSLKLRELLNVDSNILSFQNRFEIVKQDVEAKDFIQWLFQTSINTDISLLKENTSLQKKVKNLLLQGENIGSGEGVLK